MKQITHSFDYQIFDSHLELPVSDQELLEKAKEAIAGSYAPYSHYHVGAAVKLANGQIVTGSNQENMSFPAGLCAERVAVFAAMANFPGVPVDAIAISAVSDDFEVSEPVPPCGICRQAIVEFEMKFNNKIRIILGGKTGKVFVFHGMGNLLPLAFHEKGLAK
ncbi:MAG: cytidine deaminase [Bacteroidales bacterium]|nr:cytidine deaminase [Bacteroidales bacterium]